MHDQPDSTPKIGSRRSRSYLLRLWREEPASPWRAMLRSVSTKEEHLFHDLEGLVAYLETEVNGKKALMDTDELDRS
jgi:hypothetical protein